MNPTSRTYIAYARLTDFPGPQLARAAQNGAIGRALTWLHARAGFPPPPFVQSTLAPPELEEVYISTFEVGTPEPAAPLYETAYLSPCGQSRLQALEEILRFYEFFDLKPVKAPRELPDHLTVELEFMGALTHMEWLAQKKGCRTDSFSLAQRDFLVRHLVPMVKSVNERLVAETFYKQLLDGLQTFTTAHLEDLEGRTAVAPARQV